MKNIISMNINTIIVIIGNSVRHFTTSNKGKPMCAVIFIVICNIAEYLHIINYWLQNNSFQKLQLQINFRPFQKFKLDHCIPRKRKNNFAILISKKCYITNSRNIS